MLFQHNLENTFYLLNDRGISKYFDISLRYSTTGGLYRATIMALMSEKFDENLLEPLQLTGKIYTLQHHSAITHSLKCFSCSSPYNSANYVYSYETNWHTSVQDPITLTVCQDKKTSTGEREVQ